LRQNIKKDNYRHLESCQKWLADCLNWYATTRINLLANSWITLQWMLIQQVFWFGCQML